MRFSALGLGLLFALGSGCELAKLGGQQLALVNDQEPLPRAMRDERDPERRRLLWLVPDVRAFGRNALQLPVGRSYAGYYATDRKGIAFVLCASERTRLRAYRWWFPIVGSVEYKSYLDEDDARAAARALEAEGYDTWVGRVTAYSTLGFFRDPVTSVMMQKGMLDFVEVLLHEMAHQRLYVPGHTDWNEQLASLVGRRGAEQYLRARFGADRALIAELERRGARRSEVETSLRATLDELEALYASGRGEAQVLRQREPIFRRLEARLGALLPEEEPDQLRINNAHLMQYRRYLAGADELERLWADARGSWVKFWQLVERRAQQL
jgi:predicted aminopeptidase